jgi:hypothetical protein
MKTVKLFFFISLTALSLCLSSCSGDDNFSSTNDKGTFSMKIDGEKTTFDNIVITKDEPDQDGKVLITVIASQKENPDTYVSFDIYEGDTGSFATTYFYS